MGILEDYVFCPHCSSELTRKMIDEEKVKSCNKCGFIFWNKPKPVVSIILQREGKVLLIQRANEPFKDYWVLPGGFIKSGETAEDAIKREANEEIGSEIKIERIIGTYLIDDDPRGLHLDIIFSGRINGEIEISKENKTFNLFSLDQLPQKIAYKHREAIIDWNKNG